MNKEEHDKLKNVLISKNRKKIDYINYEFENYWKKHSSITCKQRFYLDRCGDEITFDEFNILFNEREYQVIKQDKIDDFFVSTVWLGLIPGYENKKPLIFETMIFKEQGLENEYIFRYVTEEEAIKGHEEAVEMVNRGEIK